MIRGSAMDIEKPAGKLAVLALTSGGADLAGFLASQLGAGLYLPGRLKGRQQQAAGRLPAHTTYFDQFGDTVERLFVTCSELVFIMATGIVVRTIAPLLRSKQSDPAVVVMDEAGQFAISLVSGHVGGANDLARYCATLTGGVPVVTTATDVRNKPAVDVLAQKLNCVPVPGDNVKKINRALAEGETVWLASRWTLPPVFTRGFALAAPPPGEWKVVVTPELPAREEKTLYLLPRNLVVGIGCRRGVPGEVLIEAMEKVLAGVPAGPIRVRLLATVDIKMDEEGIYQAARYYGVRVHFVTREEIKKMAGTYQESLFVKKAVGVGGVCEPAAMVAANQGQIIVPKRKEGSVTVAVAEEKLWWWGLDREIGNT